MDFAMSGFDGFDALDALAGAAQTILPLATGTAVTFGVAEAVNLLVSSAKVRKWKWVFGVGASLLIGGAMWRWRTPEEGALTIGAGLATGLVAFGHEQIVKYQIKKGTDPAFFGRRSFGRYEVAPAQNLFAGRYVTAPAEPLLAGMDRDETVSMGNFINPGVFG